MSKTPSKKKRENSKSNAELFKKLRRMAYKETLRFKREGGKKSKLFWLILQTARYENAFLSPPLKDNEVRGIVNSIVKFSWKEFTIEGFSEIQRRRVKIRFRDKPKSEPWRAEGVSRMTWFRRKKLARGDEKTNRPPKKKKTLYSERWEVIKAIGFHSYKDYLASGLWETIREKVFYFRGNGCVGCDSVSQCIHHGRYDLETMMGRSIEHLYPMCFKCHTSIEFLKNGEKITDGDKIQRRLQRLIVKKTKNSTAPEKQTT